MEIMETENKKGIETIKHYRFETSCTMKPYNEKKYWIDGDSVRPKIILAKNLKSALIIYCDKLEKDDYMTVSKNAILNKQPMYKDGLTGPEQVGYVITGKTDIENTVQYIDLWAEITIAKYPESEFKQEQKNV